MSYNKETGMYEGYIYKIINDIYPDKIYIGQTLRTVKERWYDHKSQIKKHIHTDKLHNLMCKYGIEHFRIESIEKCAALTKKELILILNEKEKYYINKFDSYYNGLNATKGGRDSVDHKMRPVTKYSLYGEKIKDYESIDSLKEEFDVVNCIYECCSGKCKYAYGFIWRYKEDKLDKFILPNDNEIKEAIIRFNAINKIDKYDCYGNKVCTYKNVDEASKLNNVDRNKIISCCTGRCIYVNTFIYRFSCDKFDTYKYYSDKPKLVEKRSLNGELICIYPSSREAGRDMGLNGSQISAACRGKYKQSYGYIWKYVEDPLRNVVPDFKHTKHCKTVYQYSKNGVLLNTFQSIKEASEYSGAKIDTISRQCNNKTNAILSDYVWSFCELTYEEIQLKLQNKNNKKVCQYNDKNELINIYNSISEAAESLNIKNSSGISRCCKKKRKHFRGFKWYYIDDPECPQNKSNKILKDV